MTPLLSTLLLAPLDEAASGIPDQDGKDAAEGGRGDQMSGHWDHHHPCVNPTTNGRWHCKMKAQSEYVWSAPCIHVFCEAQSVLINKISASELSRKFIKSTCCWLGKYHIARRSPASSRHTWLSCQSLFDTFQTWTACLIFYNNLRFPFSHLCETVQKWKMCILGASFNFFYTHLSCGIPPPTEPLQYVVMTVPTCFESFFLNLVFQQQLWAILTLGLTAAGKKESALLHPSHLFSRHVVSNRDFLVQRGGGGRGVGGGGGGGGGRGLWRPIKVVDGF